jgi:hypothetical protein
MLYLNPFAEQQLIKKYYDRIVIPTDKVLTLFSAPVTIIKAVPGYAPFPESVWFNKAAGIAYGLNGNTNLQVNLLKTDGTRLLLLNFTLAGFMDNVAERYYNSQFWFAVGNNDSTLTTGGSVEVRPNLAELITGTGDLEVEVIYRLIPTRVAKL